ncbi:hypothetical protein KDA_40270 [Dictyobacter alpinus]|uniref:Uncharacterized protein n=1 Tax=Dictyobacter alpinus TaxID=2014873 RepID=A0A402BAW1_9CHLR|nr:hypothetical protein [Dictyobacter alpinus]GCE28543.1 hypothetical protein KDA_40270 [Dictyobacter alpinus]
MNKQELPSPYQELYLHCLSQLPEVARTTVMEQAFVRCDVLTEQEEEFYDSLSKQEYMYYDFAKYLCIVFLFFPSEDRSSDEKAIGTYIRSNINTRYSLINKWKESREKYSSMAEKSEYAIGDLEGQIQNYLQLIKLMHDSFGLYVNMVEPY